MSGGPARSASVSITEMLRPIQLLTTAVRPSRANATPSGGAAPPSSISPVTTPLTASITVTLCPGVLAPSGGIVLLATYTRGPRGVSPYASPAANPGVAIVPVSVTSPSRTARTCTTR